MARISPTSKKYRSKDTICKDVAEVLNSSTLSFGTKSAVVGQVNWAWTEAYGKYRGCPYWSVNALKLFAKTGKIAGLRHEHAVPKKLIAEMLFELKPATPEAVRKIYDQCLVGVIVTMLEDRKLNTIYGKTMPTEFLLSDSADYRNPWLRYRLCNIKITNLKHHLDALMPFTKKNSLQQRASFEKTLEKFHWIDSDFDWAKWNEAESYFESADKLSSANLETIRKLFTVHFRKDRTCEGHLDLMYEAGHIAALVARLRQIVKNKEYMINFTPVKNA